MLFHFYALALAVANIAASKKCSPEVKSLRNVKVFGSSCYEFVTYEKKDFPDAQKHCESHGGRLAIVKEEKINKFIQKTLQSLYSYRYTPAWIGLQYTRGKGYYWSDGSNFRQSENKNFKVKDPGVDETCMGIIPETGRWREYLCVTDHVNMEDAFSVNRRRFVCEYPTV